MVGCIGALCILLMTPSISAVNHIAIKNQHAVIQIETRYEKQKKTQHLGLENVKLSAIWFLWYIAYMTARFGVFQIISEIFSFLAYRLAERWNVTEMLPPQ